MSGITEREADLIINKIDDLNTAMQNVNKAMQDGFKSVRSEIEDKYNKTDDEIKEINLSIAKMQGAYITYDKVWKTLVVVITLITTLIGTIYLFIEKNDNYERNRVIEEEARGKTTTTTTKRLKGERVFIWDNFNYA